MGNLRVEPKAEGMSRERYQELASLLRHAAKAAGDNRVFYDLDPNEKGNATRLDFIYVSKKEGINVRVRKLRKQNALELTFPGNNERGGTGSRISAEEFKDRVIQTLEKEKRPMTRGEILKMTNLSPSSWHLRIVELLDEDRVTKKGERRRAVYSLP